MLNKLVSLGPLFISVALLSACQPSKTDDLGNETSTEEAPASPTEFDQSDDSESAVQEPVAEEVEEVIPVAPIVSYKNYDESYTRTMIVTSAQGLIVNSISAFGYGCGIDYIVTPGTWYKVPFEMEVGVEYEIGTNCETERLEIETNMGNTAIGFSR
ncbi:hypothetical protein [Sphingorhabdus sp.]|jgi:hypothetical protein|uniref:hypothetical protein n=1 Tax=Sphingorhabdus sp. TaxID=1902408 RepID=UPI003783697C